MALFYYNIWLATKCCKVCKGAKTYTRSRNEVVVKRFEFSYITKGNLLLFGQDLPGLKLAIEEAFYSNGLKVMHKIVFFWIVWGIRK